MSHFAKHLRYGYHSTFEQSQFGGYRGVVRHNLNGTTMWCGQHSYKTEDEATAAATLYLNTYAERGDKAACRAVFQYAAKFAI